MKKDIYRQCELVRQDGGSIWIDVAWIPNKFAKVNKVLKILKNEVWEDNWVVRQVWSARNFSEIQLQRDAYKRWDDVLADH